MRTVQTHIFPDAEQLCALLWCKYMWMLIMCRFHYITTAAAASQCYLCLPVSFPTTT